MCVPSALPGEADQTEEVITSIPTLTTHRDLQLVEFMVRLESHRKGTQRRDLNLGWRPRDPRA